MENIQTYLHHIISWIPALLAEMLGTFLLVAIGTGSILVCNFSPTLNEILIAVAFGGTIATSIYFLRNISGAHFNPVVTLAFWLQRKMSPGIAMAYMCAQFTSALLGSVVVLRFLGNAKALGATLPHRGPLLAIVTEIFLTLVLVRIIVVGSRTVKNPAIFAIIVGTTISVCSLIGGVTSGASMNPARSLGPVLASGTFDGFWIYLIGPIVGAIFAIQSTRFRVRF